MFCQKSILIQKTYKLAEQAVYNGNHPFGALAVLDGHIIATALNLVLTQKDCTKHAELNLASFLSQNFSRSMIKRISVYCSTEPCVMCAGALYWIGCRHIIYGCSVHALSKYTTKSFSVEIRDSLLLVIPKVKIEGPILEQEGELIHRNFWNNFKSEEE